MKFKIPILVLVFMFGLMSIASAAFTLVTPADSAVLGSASVVLNATADVNQSSVTFQAFCTGTANSTFVTICTNATTYWDNTTTYATCPWTVSHMEDGAECSFKATGNDTNETDTNTGITIDLTTPTAATSLSPVDGDINHQGALTVSAAVTGAETTSCTVAWENDKYPGDGSPDTLTHSGDSCSISYDNALDGTYTYVLTVSDGTNTTESDRTSFKVDTSGSGGAVAVVQAIQAEQDSKKSSTTAIIVVVAIVAAAMYFGKKK